MYPDDFIYVGLTIVAAKCKLISYMLHVISKTDSAIQATPTLCLPCKLIIAYWSQTFEFYDFIAG